jgi:hypothetical protein
MATDPDRPIRKLLSVAERHKVLMSSGDKSISLIGPADSSDYEKKPKQEATPRSISYTMVTDGHDEASNVLTVYRGKADVTVSPHGVVPLVVHYSLPSKGETTLALCFWYSNLQCPVSHSVDMIISNGTMFSLQKQK